MNKNTKQIALAVAALLVAAVVWWVQNRDGATSRDGNGPTSGRDNGTRIGPAPTLPGGAPPAQQTPKRPAPQPPHDTSPAPPTTPASKPGATVTPVRATFNVEFIRDTDERAAVVEVIKAIDAGGPFRYRKDGSTWENRERRLPKRPMGYYHEYTVDTPGSDDRGARRLIAGDQHELYYTRDHYGSFTNVRAAQ